MRIKKMKQHITHNRHRWRQPSFVLSLPFTPSHSLSLLFSLFTFLLLTACGGGDVPQPKPKAYLRIDLPEPHYVDVDSLPMPDSLGGGAIVLPYAFEINSRALVNKVRRSPRGTTLELLYPEWKGYVELLYKPLAGRGDLPAQLDTAMRMLEFHHQVASGEESLLIQVPDNNVYATVWHLFGRKVASPCQFVATDSVAHFLHGELFIDQVPNNDSLAPMLNYMQADLNHLIETLRWK